MVVVSYNYMADAALAPPVSSVQVTRIREASRRLVRELGFIKGTLAGTALPPSAVHALLEIGAGRALTSGELSEILALEKSSVSRMIRKLIEGGDVIERASKDDGRAKLLSLTRKGRRTLAAIDTFAQQQVISALAHLGADARHEVANGLATYACALQADRTGSAVADATPVRIERGYRCGIVGRAVTLHANYYARHADFGRAFEAKVAAELAEFVDRLDCPRNAIWAALRAGEIVGTIAIDGEDLGRDVAHLRWFIVDDSLHGRGVGRALLHEAIGFCDAQVFNEIVLWTFRGLDAARKLYEGCGFSLAEEKAGNSWGREVIEQKFVRPPP